MNRIAAQVVAGIGFLGAGVIIKDERSVKGLTTAATLWCSAAIGILCGANLIVEATIGTLVILFINVVLRKLNSKINALAEKDSYDLYYFKIECDASRESDIINMVKALSTKTETKIISIKVEDESESTGIINICIANTSKINDLTNRIMQKLSHKEEVKSISLYKKDDKSSNEEEF